VTPSADSLAELMVRRAALLQELRLIAASLKARGLGRTDHVIGELAERLALSVYGGALEAVSARDIDLVDRAGRRIQVKARELPPGVTRPYRFSSRDFDVAVCIRFNRATFAIEWVREISKDEFLEIASPYGSGWQASTERVSRTGENVTSQFCQAWESLTGETYKR
jgi:hypothetical protein